MKQFKLGFVGAGNMAEAIVSGAIKKDVVSADQITLFDVNADRTQELKEKYGVGTADSMPELAKSADILVLAIKPGIMPNVLAELSDIGAKQSVVSIAAGWSAAKIKSQLKHKNDVLRIMPNMPLMAGEGMSVFESPSDMGEDEYLFVKSIFQALGLVLEQPEKLMDAVTAISGSGPAYVFMFIEALADAGVLNGISRNDSLLLATQTVLGAATAVLETGVHPAQLKDAVCSPGGTTIEAVRVLEDKGMRSAVIEAVSACAEKSKKL